MLASPTVAENQHSQGQISRAADPTPITVAYGDGIGPQIMRESLRVLEAAGAALAIEPIEIGEKAYEAGNTAGITTDSWERLRRTKVFYKAPITTPQGGGYKSLNVTVRKTLGLFANVRPCVAYHPFIATRHPGMDVVIIRENEEDLYGGIEHRQTNDVYQCLKLITRPGSQRIIRYAFDYARANGRRKVSCFTKDNIMKMTDGLFHRVFDEVASEYAEIAAEHLIIDIGTARLADTPENFDVIVTENLYGDIISDVAAQLAGSVGLAPSANIGEQCAMFEAIHGSAPLLAGRDVANPSGLLLAGVAMLVHIGQHQVAQRVHNAWLRTIEDGIHTEDVFHPPVSTQRVSTGAFADAVIARLDLQPVRFQPVVYSGNNLGIRISPLKTVRRQHKELVGVDIFVDSTRRPDELAAQMRRAENARCELVMITNRGVKVWPNGQPETYCTDHWRCRYMGKSGQNFDKTTILQLLQSLSAQGADFIKTEQLYLFDGEPGFSLGQGQ